MALKLHAIPEKVTMDKSGASYSQMLCMEEIH